MDAGTQLLAEGRIREAIAWLRDAEPTHAVHHNLAVALRASGEIDEALAHATTAAELEPTCAPTLALVGSLQSFAGDHAGALVTFRRACDVDPTHDVSRYYLGISLAAIGDRRGALTELRHVASRHSRVPASIRARADIQASEVFKAETAAQIDLCSIPLVSELVGVTARPTPVLPSRSVTERGSIGVDGARDYVDRASRIVVLTGAGISSASGLATRKELWQRFDRDRAVSIAEFRRDPTVLWTVIRDFLGDNPLVPNAAHRALVEMPRLEGIVTQNVEGLHQAAGSANVLELHGTLRATRCDQCGARSSSCVELLSRSELPRCACGSVLRPDVVLFGEWVDPLVLSRAAKLVASCDLLLVIGTAADVAPAADLPLLAAQRGATVIEIKRNASRLMRAGIAHHLAGAAEEVLPKIVRLA